MGICLLDSSTLSEWQEYVMNEGNCWLYHDAGWKQVVERAYGHKCYYFLATDDGKVTGILPLVEIRSRLFGNSLTSLPFLDSCGLAASDSGDAKMLLDSAIRLSKERDVDYLELRQEGKIDASFSLESRKAAFILPLELNETDQWNALCSERRNRVRKAQKSGLEVEFSRVSELPEFYKVWSANMRDLGSPPHSLLFFESVFKFFPQSAELLMVKHGHQYIGGAICLFSKTKVAVPWISSSRKHFRLCPNDLLYWGALKHAIEKNCSHFDFGRSTIDSGTSIYKSRWGAHSQPLFWYFKNIKNKGRQIPSMESPTYRRAAFIWQRMPVALTRLIGPPLRKKMTA